MTDDTKPTWQEIADAALTAVRELADKLAYAYVECDNARIGAESARENLRGAYRERARLLAYLAAMNISVIVPGSDPNEPNYPVLYVYDPDHGQMSWHLHPDDLHLFRHVGRLAADDPAVVPWDGHDTDTKYERLAGAIAGELAAQTRSSEALDTAARHAEAFDALRNELARVRAQLAEEQTSASETVNEVLLNASEEHDGRDAAAGVLAVEYVRRLEHDLDQAKTAVNELRNDSGHDMDSPEGVHYAHIAMPEDYRGSGTECPYCGVTL